MSGGLTNQWWIHISGSAGIVSCMAKTHLCTEMLVIAHRLEFGNLTNYFYKLHCCLLPSFKGEDTNFLLVFFFQGLNPGKAIGEIKKMLATHQGKKASAAT